MSYVRQNENASATMILEYGARLYYFKSVLQFRLQAQVNTFTMIKMRV